MKIFKNIFFTSSPSFPVLLQAVMQELHGARQIHRMDVLPLKLLPHLGHQH
jgi:hypothetical protein